MPDANNLPAGGTGDDVSDIMDALAGIIDDPETDNAEDEQAQTAADKAKPEGEEIDPEEDGQPEDEAEDDAEDPEADGEAKPVNAPDAEKGRFVADSAKVKLEDGRVVSIGELRKSPMFQGDYTRKTQEVAEHRKMVEAERERVSQLAQQTEQQLAVNMQWLELTRPVRPEVSYEDDPVAYLRFQDESQKWNEAHQWVMQHINTRKAAFESQQKEQLAAYEKREDEALRTAIPALRDQGKYRAFMAELEKIAPDYGITPDELKGVKDHRQILVLRDALAYRRMKARAPEVRKAIEGKPPVVTSAKRTNPKQSQQRAKQNRTERLQRDPTFDNGVAALMDLDL